MRRRRQAVPHWELERALRRAALRRGILVGLGGALVALVAFGFLVLLFTS